MQNFQVVLVVVHLILLLTMAHRTWLDLTDEFAMLPETQSSKCAQNKSKVVVAFDLFMQNHHDSTDTHRVNTPLIRRTESNSTSTTCHSSDNAVLRWSTFGGKSGIVFV